VQLNFHPVKENELLLRKLAKSKQKNLDQMAARCHEEVFASTDCLICASCCKSIPPIVNKTDAGRISRYLGMKPSAFEMQYLVLDEDGDRVINNCPCPFLASDNSCEIYPVRPKACREYPHTGDYKFSANMRLHAKNALVCPAVSNILILIMKKLEKA
jgi:uncharacterized protein